MRINALTVAAPDRLRIAANFFDHLTPHISAVDGLLNHDEQALAAARPLPQLADDPLFGGVRPIGDVGALVLYHE